MKQCSLLSEAYMQGERKELEKKTTWWMRAKIIFLRCSESNLLGLGVR